MKLKAWHKQFVLYEVLLLAFSYGSFVMSCSKDNPTAWLGFFWLCLLGVIQGGLLVLLVLLVDWRWLTRSKVFKWFLRDGL